MMFWICILIHIIQEKMKQSIQLTKEDESGLCIHPSLRIYVMVVLIIYITRRL